MLTNSMQPLQLNFGNGKSQILLHLAAQPSASDSATGWHCALYIFIY